jgi:hypothetical protein
MPISKTFTRNATVRATDKQSDFVDRIEPQLDQVNVDLTTLVTEANILAGRIVVPVTAANVGAAAPANAELGFDPATGKLFYVDGANNWQQATIPNVSPNGLTYTQAVNGQINFVVGGTTVGSVAISGGLPKWTLAGALDPIAYAGTPQTLAQRNALTPSLGWLVYVKDTGASLNEYQMWDGATWKTVGSGGAAPNRLFLSNTLVAPAVAGQPTLAEITTAVGANRDTLVYYTGDNTAANPPTYIYWVDGAGAVTLLRSPATAAAAMTGATAAAAGTAGQVPAPAAGTQDSVLHGDGLWRMVIPNWAASTAYSVGAPVFQNGRIWRATTAHTSAATFTPAEQANWTALADIGGTATTFISNTTMAPAVVGNPTLAEATTAITTAGLTDALVYYNGSNSSASAPTYVWHVDRAGMVVLLRSPAVPVVQTADVGTPAPAGSTLGYDPSTGELFRADIAGVWRTVPIGRQRFFLGDTEVGPAVPGAPTAAEVQAFTTPNNVFDTVAYYTGDENPASPPTYVFHVDQGGDVTLLRSSADGVFLGATTATPGTAGDVPAPPAGSQSLVLTAAGVFDSPIRPWTGTRFYAAGSVVSTSGGIWYRIADGTAAASFTPAEQANWTLLADITGTAFFKGSLATLAALTALTTASLVAGQAYRVGDTIYVWDPTATGSSGGVQPSDTVSPGITPGYWVPTAGHYRGAYSATAPYAPNDMVLSGGSLWRINVAREAGSYPGTPTEGPSGPNSWTRVTSPVKGPFNFAQSYASGDLVYDASGSIGPVPGIYRATAAHTAGNFPSPANWADLAIRAVYRGDFTGLAYAVGDVVFYQGSLYRCITAHGTNAIGGPFTAANWDHLAQDLISVYQPTSTVTAGTLITDNGGLWESNTNHTTALLFDDSEKASWTQLTTGSRAAVRSVTANYTVQSWDEVIIVDTTTGNVTITIPLGLGIGKKVTVHKSVAANSMTVTSTALITSAFGLGTSETFTAQYSNIPYVVLPSYVAILS